MKNKFLSVAAIGLLAATLVSCDATKKVESSIDSTAVNTIDSNLKDSSTSLKTNTTSTIPTFSSEEVNKGLVEYSKLKDEYIIALKSQDVSKIQKLGTKYTAWAEGASTWSGKLKSDELQAYSDYMTKLSQEWAKATEEAVK